MLIIFGDLPYFVTYVSSAFLAHYEVMQTSCMFLRHASEQQPACDST